LWFRDARTTRAENLEKILLKKPWLLKNFCT
jgi:hypothetical protein